MRVVSITSDEFEDVTQDCLNFFDMLEIRHDSQDILNYALIRKQIPIPLIYTHHFAKEPRVDFYQEALEQGFDWIDCDFNFFKAHRQKMSFVPSEKLVLSWHLKNLESAWDQLFEIREQSLQQEKSVIKLAFPCDDAALACQFLKKWNEEFVRSDRVLSIMGKGGEFLRICAPILKQKWSYFSFKKPTAPGQISMQTYLEEGYPKSFDSQSKIYAVCGEPISHSQSPRIHNQYFLEAGKSHCMVRMPTTNPQVLLENAPDLLAGLACTMPVKQSFANILNSPTPVNTLLISKGKTEVYNTDVMAIANLLQVKLPHWRQCIKKIVVVGAGGLAHACILEFLKFNIPMVILNRTESKAIHLATVFGIQHQVYGKPLDLDGSLVLQASACGMQNSLEIPFPPNSLTPSTAVLESVYANQETALLSQARARGCVTIDGLEMFMEQARLQNQLFLRENS